MTRHATTIAIGGRGVMIEGPSGAGKSDLALRLIDRGAILVADDRTVISRRGDTIYADAPASIAGLLEIRGVGIVKVASAGPVPVALVVAIGAPDRLPERETVEVEGVALPRLRVLAPEASAPLKVEWALRACAA